MKTFDVQSIELEVPAAQAHAYIAQPRNLPAWTHAFSTAEEGNAVMRTPRGEVEIRLRTLSDPATGSVDWTMAFPDGSRANAYSRVVPVGERRCAYAFILLAPPVPLELLEGALAAQMETLSQELLGLKHILEAA